LIHAGSAGVLVILLVAGWDLFRVVVATGALAALVFEAVRLKSNSVRIRIADLIPVFRQSEDHRISGATWLCVGYALAVLFPPVAPAGGILVGALADPAASWVGSHRGKPGKKTVAGSLAALVVSLVALWLIGLTWPAVLGGAVAGTLLERWPGPFDDNLVIAPGVAGVVWIAA
jgi:dolichol kinase